MTVCANAYAPENACTSQDVPPRSGQKTGHDCSVLERLLDKRGWQEPNESSSRHEPSLRHSPQETMKRAQREDAEHRPNRLLVANRDGMSDVVHGRPEVAREGPQLVKTPEHREEGWAHHQPDWRLGTIRGKIPFGAGLTSRQGMTSLRGRPAMFSRKAR